ncbi:MAG: hypothetical protein JNM99_24980 [Verrucomicrobiaceae bacterium]|nr:hypothetical protein [Verrucomicrobiaceae bacterium]
MSKRLFIAPLHLALLIAASVTVPTFGHPADVSYLRVRVEHDSVDLRFSLNVATLARIVRIDANGDNQVTFDEIEKAVPAVREFLTRSTLVSINDRETTAGEFKNYECVWPSPKDSMLGPQDAGQRFVDFHFHQPWPSGVVDVWLGFKVFEQLGDLHTIQCIYQQPGEHDTPVSFSQHEPEFLYDTGWNATTSALETESAAQTPAHQPHRWLMTIAAIASIALLVRFLFGRK